MCLNKFYFQKCEIYANCCNCENPDKADIANNCYHNKNYICFLSLTLPRKLNFLNSFSTRSGKW